MRTTLLLALWWQDRNRWTEAYWSLDYIEGWIIHDQHKQYKYMWE